jgi:hypothetical protein
MGFIPHKYWGFDRNWGIVFFGEIYFLNNFRGGFY